MRQLFLYTLLISITFGLVVSDATAGRFGGRGFGMMNSRNAFSHSPRITKTTPAAASKSKMNNRWRGALTGLLLGSVLTSLFMGHGFGGAILSWLLVGLSIYFIVYLLRRKTGRVDNS